MVDLKFPFLIRLTECAAHVDQPPYAPFLEVILL